MYFSIIIPVLNEERVLLANLLALQPLRSEHCELIVVDGGSNDATVSIAQPLVDQLVQIKPPGRARQMNQGAAMANGEVLVFLHADTVLPNQALSLIEAGLAGDKQWGRFAIQLTGTPKLLPVIATLMNWRSRLTGIATGDQVIFAKKAAFMSAGQYPNIRLMEDITLCAALKKLSPPCCLSATVISSGRRWQQFGVIKTILLMWNLRLRYYFGADPDDLATLYERGLFWKH